MAVHTKSHSIGLTQCLKCLIIICVYSFILSLQTASCGDTTGCPWIAGNHLCRFVQPCPDDVMDTEADLLHYIYVTSSRHQQGMVPGVSWYGHVSAQKRIITTACRLRRWSTVPLSDDLVYNYYVICLRVYYANICYLIQDLTVIICIYSLFLSLQTIDRGHMEDCPWYTCSHPRYVVYSRCEEPPYLHYDLTHGMTRGSLLDTQWCVTLTGGRVRRWNTVTLCCGFEYKHCITCLHTYEFDMYSLAHDYDIVALSVADMTSIHTRLNGSCWYLRLHKVCAWQTYPWMGARRSNLTIYEGPSVESKPRLAHSEQLTIMIFDICIYAIDCRVIFYTDVYNITILYQERLIWNTCLIIFLIIIFLYNEFVHIVDVINESQCQEDTDKCISYHYLYCEFNDRNLTTELYEHDSSVAHEWCMLTCDLYMSNTMIFLLYFIMCMGQIVYWTQRCRLQDSTNTTYASTILLPIIVCDLHWTIWYWTAMTRPTTLTISKWAICNRLWSNKTYCRVIYLDLNPCLSLYEGPRKWLMCEFTWLITLRWVVFVTSHNIVRFELDAPLSLRSIVKAV